MTVPPPCPAQLAAPAPSRAEKETGRCGFLRDFLGFPHKRADSSDAGSGWFCCVLLRFITN